MQGHYWTPKAYTLPLKFRYEVRADTNSAECIGAFSHSKQGWGGDNVVRKPFANCIMGL